MLNKFSILNSVWTSDRLIMASNVVSIFSMNAFLMFLDVPDLRTLTFGAQKDQWSLKSLD